uniref:Uncharacterized protein n=1 Tax=Moniliophthora roreri TaxID=221103 RepID=A0A0W0FHG7_MONRR
MKTLYFKANLIFVF